MRRTLKVVFTHSIALFSAVGVLACADEPALAPELDVSALADARGVDVDAAVQTLRRVTAVYHDLDVAVDDGFVLLHPCEARPDEGPVGTVYVHMERLLDGVIDPELPDALIYEPQSNGRPRLVGVEFALPYPMWTAPEPPQFLGQAFQPEDEFGVWALHVWVWRNNPEGMFAEANPHITCAE